MYFHLLQMAIMCILSGYGDVRLGIGNYSGTLEVFMTEGRWTTVCLGGFDDAAATVVCRQLGYDHGFYYSTCVLSYV